MFVSVYVCVYVCVLNVVLYLRKIAVCVCVCVWQRERWDAGRFMLVHAYRDKPNSQASCVCVLTGLLIGHPNTHAETVQPWASCCLHKEP